MPTPKNKKKMNIYHNLEAIKDIAIESAKEHDCNYNVILVNPGEDGKFNVETGSTYEFVADSYFEKPRPNAIILHRTDDLISTEMPFCLLWDLDRKEYARVQSPWSDEDLKSVARFEVRARFKTEAEVIDALEKAKIIPEENKKSTGRMGIVVGAGNLVRTIIHENHPSPVIMVDSQKNPFEMPEPFAFTNPHGGILNIDHDIYPAKRKGGSNFTSKKKKRKK